MNGFWILCFLGLTNSLAQEAGWRFSLSRNEREVLSVGFASMEERNDVIVTPQGSFRVRFLRAEGGDGPLMWFHFLSGESAPDAEVLCGGALEPVPDAGPPVAPFKAVVRKGPWTCGLEAVVEPAGRARRPSS